MQELPKTALLALRPFFQTVDKYQHEWECVMKRFAVMGMLFAVCLLSPYASYAAAAKVHPVAIFYWYRFARNQGWPTWAIVLIVVFGIGGMIYNLYNDDEGAHTESDRKLCGSSIKSDGHGNV